MLPLTLANSTSPLFRMCVHVFVYVSLHFQFCDYASMYRYALFCFAITIATVAAAAILVLIHIVVG